MKKYTYMFAVLFFASAFVSPVFAGGGYEDYTLNPDGTVNVTTQNEQLRSTTTTDGTVYDENGNVVEQKAAASGAVSALGTPAGVSVAVLVLLIIAGVVYGSYKKSQPRV